MRNRFKVAAMCSIVMLFVCSCSTAQHNNTLIFGTNTKFAVDISVASPPSQPSVTVGYARQEFVWMPLSMNLYKSGDSGQPQAEQCAKTPFSDCFYQGKQSGDADAYSVLASFGSNTSGTGDGVQIAQYFATGLAARTLAAGGGASLVNTSGVVAAQAAVDKIALIDTASTAIQAKLGLKYQACEKGRLTDELKKFENAALSAGYPSFKGYVGDLKAPFEKSKAIDKSIEMQNLKCD